MKEYLAEQLKKCATPLEAKNLTREYLQARILECLQHAGAMIPLAFHGGTALRFLFSMPRYSEDLDFAADGAKKDYDLESYIKTIKNEMTAEGYIVQLKVNDQKTVNSVFVRFPGLLYNLGLSPHRDAVIAVKFEVDTNPPAGAVLETTVVRRHVTLQLQHHDRSSMLAGKLHSVLARSYTKGRDIYDLFWYLADTNWPAPNFVQLNNALHQTNWRGETLNMDNWRGILRNRLTKLSWEKVAEDVRPFLERPLDYRLLTKENMIRLLGDSNSA